jgi:hypothetical protein
LVYADPNNREDVIDMRIRNSGDYRKRSIDVRKRIENGARKFEVPNAFIPKRKQNDAFAFALIPENRS